MVLKIGIFLMVTNKSVEKLLCKKENNYSYSLSLFKFRIKTKKKMSYDISLYRIETKEKEQTSNDDGFFENTENLVPFTAEQFQALKERLTRYDYKLSAEDSYGLHFNHPNEDYGTALLTKGVVYFQAGWNKDSIFEVGMTVSEFTDSGEYAKYDPQNGEWETWE